MVVGGQPDLPKRTAVTQLQPRSLNAAFPAHAFVDFVVVPCRVKASNLDKPETGRGASPLYNHGGTVVVAGAWLAFYVFAAIHDFMASSF